MRLGCYDANGCSLFDADRRTLTLTQTLTLTLTQVDPERPVLVDKYLDRADELDVDALCDKDGDVTICGIMQHIEQARRPDGTCILSSAVP